MARARTEVFDVVEMEKPSRCIRFFRLLWKFSRCVFSHVTLISLVVAYCLIGAYAFESLEANYEREVKKSIKDIRGNVSEKLWEITKDFEVLIRENWTEQALSELKKFEDCLLKKMEKEGWDGSEEEDNIQWTFAGALFYSIIVITTIVEIVPSKPDGISYVLPNLENDSTATELRARTVEKLWSITEDLNVLYKENWTRLAAREVLEFQENLARGLRRTSYEQAPPRQSREHQRLHARRWTFSSSLLYSLTLITTIGYGSVAPRTVWGRLITIVYALAGIPLMLVYLSTVGDVLARSFRRLYGRVCRRPRNCARKQQPPPPPPPVPVGGIMAKAYRYDNHVETKGTGAGGNYYSASRESSCDDLGIRGTGSAILLDCGSEGLLHATTSSTAALQDVTAGNGKRHFHPCSLSLSSTSSPAFMLEANPVRIPISLCLAIMLVYICGGAVMFNRLEGWGLLEGGYFCFTSLGTIGFGDLMPVGRNAPSTTLEELSLCACSLYILAGMGLIAMCFNLVQEEVVRVVRVFGRTCGMSSSVVVGPIGGTAGAISGLKADLDDGGGTSDSRLSEQEEEAIAMSMVPAGS